MKHTDREQYKAWLKAKTRSKQAYFARERERMRQKESYKSRGHYAVYLNGAMLFIKH